MMVEMRKGATKQEIDGVVERAKSLNFDTQLNIGTDKVVGLYWEAIRDGFPWVSSLYFRGRTRLAYHEAVLVGFAGVQAQKQCRININK